MFMTMKEYETIKIFELDELTYKKIYNRIYEATKSERLTNKLMRKFWLMTVKELSTQSIIDIMDIIVIIY